MPLQSRSMGTYGYSAPEYSRSGRLTPISDVYSFGVVLLELITGRRVMDTTKPVDEQNLVAWAQPIFREPKRFPEMADPLLKKRFPERDLNQAVGIAAMCLQDEATARPLMSDVVTALSFLSMAKPESCIPPVSSKPQSQECVDDEKLNKQDSESDNESDQDDDDGEDDDDDDDDDRSSRSHSRSSSIRSRSMNSYGESRVSRDYSRRYHGSSRSREEISSHGGNVSSRRENRRKSKPSISQDYSQGSQGSSEEDRRKSTKLSSRKSSKSVHGNSSKNRRQSKKVTNNSRSSNGES
ncbi:hypothetical protein E1A91_A05G422000v1 [Gossypium mustelinum]|uniref:Protein kinase domain-containing protein n=1 Tax=Gossypium mustelinum TaxID=34275 RepID=A0A5D2ZJC9_GOSMU|nr:hypothetical protein E1A91_A05G422000v1 [Gossypium mustelinum]